MYQEKRIWCIRISSMLTASSSQILFKSRLPQCRDKVLFEKGEWKQISRGKSTYVMMLCTHKLLSEIDDILQFVVKITDVTNNLVNDSDYTLKPEVIKDFDYVKFEKAYSEIYLRDTPLAYAQKMIDKLGNKSRYQDHQVILKHKKKQ